jgi:putative ABC transport system permease protein
MRGREATILCVLVFSWWNDLRYAWRALRNSPGFTVVAILTLGLGIGANTAVYSFLDGFLLKPLPYPEPGRIIRILQRTQRGEQRGVSAPDFLDWQQQATAFEFLAGQATRAMTLSGVERPTLVRAAWVSPSYFGISRLKPILGRGFAADDAEPGKDHVVVLSHELWTNALGGDRGIIGKVIRLDGEPHTVVGVMPEATVFDRSFAQLWKPLAFGPGTMNRGFGWFGVFGRLKPDVTLEQARAQMDGIAARIAREYPDSNEGVTARVDRFADILVPSGPRQALYILMAAAAMVLLTGCVNLANLALARGAAREREVAVRAALGAGQWALMRQFLVESVLLSLAGGTAGVAIGYATMRWLTAQIPANSYPAEVAVQLDGRVLLFALAISVVTGLLFGLAPAMQAAKLDLAGSMKDGGRGASSGGTRRRVRDALVVAEVALAFVLLVGSGLLIRSFFELLNVDPGFNSANVLTLRLPSSRREFPNPEQYNNYLRQIRSTVESVPGVQAVAFTSALPLQGWAYGMGFAAPEQASLPRAERPIGFYKMVSPSYFQTLGLRVRSGRGLSDRDTKGSPPVVVINETLARRYFANQNPVGQRILIAETRPGLTELGPDVPWEVAGVIADEKINALDDQRSAGVYVSSEQSPVYGPSLAVRTAANPRLLEQAIRQAIAKVNADQAISSVQTMDEIKDQSMLIHRLETLLLSAFAAVALLLAAVGIYGVLSYSVTQRTQEMGIRGALGASAASIQGLILGDGLSLVLTGLGLGAIGSWALTRLMSSMLYGVSASDPLTLLVTAVVLSGTAMAACYLPARRATKVDPIVALRYE